MNYIVQTSRAASLAAIILGLIVAAMPTGARAEVREEFHQTYTLDAKGRVSVENVNGDVRVSTWERNEVKVDAVKRAASPDRLAEMEIKIDSNPSSLRIETRYPDHWFNHGDSGRVDYTLLVPRGARLDKLDLVNGNLEVQDVEGEVAASSVNGRVKVTNVSGDLHLSAVNGTIEATPDRLDEGRSISLDAVNGSIELNLPPDASASLDASTVSGGIHNDFGLPVSGGFVGHELRGKLGDGRARVKLNNVNGSIKIRRSKEVAN